MPGSGLRYLRKLHLIIGRYLDFTYCGFAIDIRNLDISIDLSRKLEMRKYIGFRGIATLIALPS